MAFQPTALNIIALIFIIVSIIKLLVILINKKDWLPVVRTFYSKPIASSIIVAILTVIVFYFLIQQLSIVEIISAAAFISLLFMLSFLQFKKELLEMATKIYKDKLSPATWVYILIWLGLMGWALYELFF